MTTVDQELLDVALEALSKHKARIEDLTKLQESLKKQLSEVGKDLDKELASMKAEVESTITSTLASIEIPKDGTDGKDGEVGPQGERGEAGPKGDRGERGLQGPKGDKGDVGPKGLDGRDGKDGKEGKPGKNGKNGKDGKSLDNEVVKKEIDGIITKKLEEHMAKMPIGSVNNSDYFRPTMKRMLDVELKKLAAGQVLTYGADKKWANVTTGTNIDVEKATQLELLYDTVSVDSYKDFIKVDGIIVEIGIYTDSSKTTKLFTKSLNYVDGAIVSVIITNETSGASLVKTYTYVNGDIDTITVTYTE